MEFNFDNERIITNKLEELEKLISNCNSSTKRIGNKLFRYAINEEVGEGSPPDISGKLDHILYSVRSLDNLLEHLSNRL